MNTYLLNGDIPTITENTGKGKIEVVLRNDLNQFTLSEAEGFTHLAHPVKLLEAGYGLTKFEDKVLYLIMLDRYSQTDQMFKTLKIGDIATLVVKPHPKYPTRGFGKVVAFDESSISVKVEHPTEFEGQTITVSYENASKPLELFWEQIAVRVANGVSSVEETPELRREWFEKFYWLLEGMYGLPGGRILYGAGSNEDVTLFNCFVLPFIQDSRGGIISHIGYATEIMSRGGGVGTNGSTLRPAKAYVKGVNGKSSGSVSWLDYISKLTHLIEQGGSRRGAQMISIADWHPDVLLFILSKTQNPAILQKIVDMENFFSPIAESLIVRDGEGKAIGVKDKNALTGANISVLISDDFMKAVENNESWTLRFPNVEILDKEQKDFYNKEWQKIGDVRKWEAMGLPVKEYLTIDANELWDVINIAARYSAEPGLIFIDRYNNESNAYYYAPIITTNPCGEQGLPEFGVCNLFAINLAKMANADNTDIDWDLFKKVIHISQRFADNVIDHSFYFLEENEKMAKGERRVGKGVMGLADLMIKLQLPYGNDDMLAKTNEVFEFLAVESYKASTDIAEEKGSFPFFKEAILESGFMKRMPNEVRNAVREKGLRNVCSLTVAPTGTTGTMAGVGTGLEPYYSFKMYRNGGLGIDVEMNVAIAQEYFAQNPEATELPEYFVSAMDLSPEQHVKVQATIQRWIDSSISKTANAPKHYTVEDTKKLYELAYKLGCKGVTIYVDGSRDTQVLSTTKSTDTEETATEVVEIQTNEDAELLMEDTRTCEIRFENGVMIKEC